MFNLIGKNGWLTGLLIFSMPILLVFFLGSQMAYSQVNSQFETYQNIPEVTSLAQLDRIAPEQVVMVRGQIAESAPTLPDLDLVVFQQRPTGNREVRFGEEFNLIFPDFEMILSDGQIRINPSLTRAQVIQHELHSVSQGDLTLTGFRPGDLVTVQGEWQPDTATLREVTGITGADKASLIAEWQDSFKLVGWARDGLGLLTLVSLVLLVVRVRQSRTEPIVDEPCQTQKTETATIV